MGRANWENATFAMGNDWKLIPNQPIVVYGGNDRRSGHIYKFVTTQPYTTGMTKAQVRALLEDGKLYVAHCAGLDNTHGRRLAAGMAMPTEAAPGTGKWIELSTTSTAIAPNATALGTPTKTVGQALVDVNWNGIGGFPNDQALRKALFTASLKTRRDGAATVPRTSSTTRSARRASTSRSRTTPARSRSIRTACCSRRRRRQPNRGDRVGGIFAMQEAQTTTPATSTTFTYWQVWSGTLAGDKFDAGNPDNIVLDSSGGVWFGTDGYWGTSEQEVGGRPLLSGPRSDAQDDAGADLRARVPHRRGAERRRGHRSGLLVEDGHAVLQRAASRRGQRVELAAAMNRVAALALATFGVASTVVLVAAMRRVRQVECLGARRGSARRARQIASVEPVEHVGPLAYAAGTCGADRELRGRRSADVLHGDRRSIEPVLGLPHAWSGPDEPRR